MMPAVDGGGGQGEAEQPSDTEQGGVNRLRQQVRDREIAQRLNRRLISYKLPDVELRSPYATRMPLRSHITGWVAVEFYPGDGAGGDANSDIESTAVAHAHAAEYADSFRELTRAGARTLAVISDLPTAIGSTTALIDPRGLVFCDPELLIADALVLPTVEDGEARRYRRLTLLARDARIERVIFPPDENLDHHLQQIVSLIRAARG